MTHQNRRGRAVHTTILLATWLALVPLHLLAADDDRQILTAEDVLNVSWVVRPVLSPDGRRAVYTLIHTRDGSRQTTVWLTDTAEGSTPRQVFAALAGVGSLRYAPDGTRLAFLADNQDGGSGRQVYLAQADGTGARRLTSLPGGVISFRWSPDSRQLALVVPETPAPEGASSNGEPLPAVHRLWSIRADGGSPRRVTGNERHVIDLSWSPDGRQFALLSAPAGHTEASGPPLSLSIVSSTDGTQVRVLADEAATGCDLAWSPDGTTIAATIPAPRKISRRLALFPAAGGAPSFPLDDYPATPMAHTEWSADSRALYVQCLERTRNQLIRIEPASGKIDRACDELTNFWDYAVTPDEATIALSAETHHTPTDLVIQRQGQTHRLTNVNPQLAQFLLGDVRTVSWPSSLDGRTIYAVLITPAGYQPGRRYPTVVNLHSGPHWIWWEGWVGTYLSWGQYLASGGYVVLMPNHRGSLGQGWEFAEAHYQEWGRGDYQDVMDGVDWLIEQGIADPDRLAIGGGSFGGYLTAWTITQTDRFQAAVVDAGWTDLVTANLTIDVPEPMRRYLGGNELEQGDLFRSRSPLTFVMQCQTPTLILHGERDRRAPTDQGRMFHRALSLLGVESQLVIYKDEGHGLARRDNQLDSLRRVKAWFDVHLGMADPPERE